MRNDVFSVSFAFEGVEQIFIVVTLLFAGDKMGKLANPRGRVIFEILIDLLLRHGLEFLEEVDSPGGVADELVAAGLLFQRRHVDQAVHVLHHCGHYLRQKHTIYNLPIFYFIIFSIVFNSVSMNYHWFWINRAQKLSRCPAAAANTTVRFATGFFACCR